MRITFIVDHIFSDLGGTENQLLKIVSGLSGAHELEIINLRPTPWMQANQAVFKCRVTIFDLHEFRRAYTYRNFFKLVSHLRNTRPAVVHTFFPVSNCLGVFAARLAGIRNIVASRRDYGEWMSSRYLAVTRIANRFVARIVSNSDEVKRLTARVEKFPAQRIDVIYNGIEVERFVRGAPNQELKQALGIAPGNLVIGLIANFRPMKRQETFVRAAALLLQQRRDITFVLVGGNATPGKPKEELQATVQSLGLEANIRFGHAAGNVKDYLSLLDIGVNCSQGEGLSNAIMEYMASGIPCIAASSGGNPDLITHDQTGLLFALDDAEQLAANMQTLVANPQQRQRLAAAALAKVRSEMALEVMLKRFDMLYSTLNSGGQGRAGA